MLNSEQIEGFYKAVDNLKLKFPVAAIAKATGFSKGTVSDYLARKKEPSENFIKKFDEMFAKGSTWTKDGEEGDLKVILKSLQQLIANNTTLADSQKTLANTNQELVLMLKFSSHNTGEASEPSEKKSKEQRGPFRHMEKSLDKPEIVLDQVPTVKKKKDTV